MITCFSIPETTRDLYFNLSSSIQLANPIKSESYKIAGLYAIYKDGKCYYVGQSKNLPSRIADHLSGKYSSADEIRIYLICEHGFEDFWRRTKEAQKTILDNNELRLMQLLKPIDNLVIDYDVVIPDEILFEKVSTDRNLLGDIACYISKGYATVFDNEILCLDDVDARIISSYDWFIANIRKGKKNDR